MTEPLLQVEGLRVRFNAARLEAVRRVMRRPAAGVRIARVIMLRWLDLDAARPRPPGPAGFTPWAPSGK